MELECRLDIVVILASESQHKWSSVPCTMRLFVDDERMWPVGGLVVGINASSCFTALTLLVG